MRDRTGQLCCIPLAGSSGCNREGHSKECACKRDGTRDAARKKAVKEAVVSEGWLTVRHNKGLFFLGSLGALFIAISTAIFAFNPLEIIAKSQLTLKDGNFAYEAWRKPPVHVGVKMYVYNYTNTEAFLRGEEKLRVVEAGPYMYTEILENTNVTFNANNSVTYTPIRTVLRSPEMAHLDLRKLWVIVPNVVYLGALSYLADHSIIANMAFNTFSTFLNSEPFLNITVHEALWNYDDPIIRYANKIAPETIHFDKFGYMDRMFDDGVNVVTMNLNEGLEKRANGRDARPLSIESYNGYPGMRHWGYDAGDNRTQHKCNLLQGYATEGVLFPRKTTPNDSFVIYRKAFCRTMEIVFDYQANTAAGVPAYYYKMKDGAFDMTGPENVCYCNRKKGPCLARGLSDISPCYYNIPTAVSFPHFYNADPRLAQAIDGLNPNREDHASIAVLQPDMGLLMRAHSRMQTNLVMKNTRYNAKSAPLNNMIIPVFWVDFYFDELPLSLASIVHFIVVVAPLLQTALMLAFATAGVIMTAISLINIGSLIRVAGKRHRKESMLFRAGYQTVQIVPIIRRESLGAA